MTLDEIEELRLAAIIVGGAVHPDTKEIIAAPMRMSGFVSFSVPIIALMLFTPNQTPAFNACLQFINQTYMAGINHGNRNASTQSTRTDFAWGYCSAVVASVGISYATRWYWAP
jgi:hypothetical protein